MNPRDATKTLTLMLTWALVLSTGVIAAGCGGNQAPHGSPILLKAYWQIRNQQIQFWPVAPDGGSAAPVPPGASQFNLVFDRVLDGSKIEDTIVINGITGPTAKKAPLEELPLTVSWPDMGSAAIDPPFNLSVWYNSIPLAGEAAGTAYVYGRETPSYPSSTALTIALQHKLITSEYNEPMTGPEEITVMTQPFSLAGGSLPAGDGGVDPGADAGAALPNGGVAPVDYWLPLQFNNRTADTVATLPPFIHVTSDGVPVTDFRLVPDPQDPTLVYLQPPVGSASQGQTWTNGARIEVTIDAALPDVFGATLGIASTASFIACSRCSGSATDGGAPVDAPIDTASDTAVDAPIDTPIDTPFDIAATDAGNDAPIAIDAQPDLLDPDAAVDAGVDADPDASTD
jgi:hypothetical protein